LEFESPALHIELQPGSYRVHFRSSRPIPVSVREPELPLELTAIETEQPVEISSDAEPMRKPRRWRSLSRPSWLRLHSWWSWVGALLLILLTVAGCWRGIQLALPSPQDRFWSPMLSARQSVLLYLGSNATYIFSPDYLAKYRETHRITANGPEFFVDLLPGDTVRATDLLAVHDTFVTVGDVAAATQLATVITAWKKPYVMRSGRDINFADLRNRPSIMIGAFNNPWTLELTKNLPFSFLDGNRIQSRDHPERAWSVSTSEHSSTSDDYSLITRLPVSTTGGPLLTAAGIGQYGTQAAAEFLASPDRMRDLLKDAPHGWRNKNMQVVLHVKIIGFTPVAVEVLATSYW
jgi:hypothetical protein